ncbi:MAG: biopolymer transporter ExbD [Puniceicoccaceae bacterium]|nr:MAG: biopolymer transporter ExbD [Puniceicoccaceae bacterium]
MIRRKAAFAPEGAFAMAPMIDMVFLLLVFFMCVSTLSQAGRLVEVELPESATSVVPDEFGERVMVSLTAEGEIWLGAAPVESPARLTELLRELAAASPRLRLHLRADRELEFRRIREVLQAGAEAGIADIIYATHQGD